jgi:dGTPase
LSRLKEQRLLETYGLDELTGPFESIVEMACLMHDIGNPPLAILARRRLMTGLSSGFPSDAVSQPLSDDRCIVRDLRLREGEDG